MYRVAIISYHTCPVAPLGGPETGGLNVGACPERSEGSVVSTTTGFTE